MEEADFKKRTDGALTALHRALIMAGDDYGFESSLHRGEITVEFEKPPAKFVIASDEGGRQIRITLPSRSYKLDWDIVENTFIHTESRQTLKELVEQAISKHLKEEIEL
jgi:frataxin-like iron-binding protein CyaY